ncbi:hypothetical protein, partial [Hymenobacter sp. AT01-02]|uniref:hypothetical protein n=1 Tax=Hymenobacter sp. AT01-02 TaxID=1571877 RepID=UPI000AF6E88F
MFSIARFSARLGLGLSMAFASTAAWAQTTPALPTDTAFVKRPVATPPAAPVQPASPGAGVPTAPRPWLVLSRSAASTQASPPAVVTNQTIGLAGGETG